jgi:Ca2+-binding EF-hand superfamily protein
MAAAPAAAQTKAAKPAKAAGEQPLARTQFLAQMDTQFRAIDADGNGQLSVAEIEQSEKKRLMAEAQARNDALFDRLDTNNNGQISATEFAKLVAEPAGASAQPMLSREDRNRDNQISLVEHRTATLASFDRLDMDKDGNVTADEMKVGGITPR